MPAFLESLNSSNERGINIAHVTLNLQEEKKEEQLFIFNKSSRFFIFKVLLSIAFYLK